MALLALDVSALAAAPALIAADVDRDMLRSALLCAALAGRPASGDGLQAQLLDLRCDDLTRALEGTKGARGDARCSNAATQRAAVACTAAADSSRAQCSGGSLPCSTFTNAPLSHSTRAGALGSRTLSRALLKPTVNLYEFICPAAAAGGRNPLQLLLDHGPRHAPLQGPRRLRHLGKFMFDAAKHLEGSGERRAGALHLDCCIQTGLITAQWAQWASPR